MIILLGLVLIGWAVWWFRRDKNHGAATPPSSWPAFVGALESERGGTDARLSADGDPAGQVVLRGLTKRFGTLTAVDDVSFVVRPGRVTGFLGPNGAGKSTTLRMIVGLVTPSAGSATIGGDRYRDLVEPLRRVGAVLEDSAAHRGRSGRDHLRVLCRSAGIPLARADEVLALVGLTAAGRRPVREYSLGMRQRLGIAAALIGDPRGLILDEPANGLDPEGIRWMRDLLRGLASAGRTVLVSSHLLAEVQLLADDLIIVADGRLIALGSVNAVIDSMARPGRTLVRTPEVEKLTAALDAGAVVTPGTDGAVYVSGVDAAAIGDAAQRGGIALHQLATERPDLEEVFLELTTVKAAVR